MQLKKTTWILMITALVLSGWVALSGEFQKRQEIKNSAAQKIFNVEEDQIRKIMINQKDLTLEFEAILDQENSWSMVQPEKTLADDAAISFLTELLVSGTSDRVITLNHNSLAEYGLDQPIATITFVTTDGKTHKIRLGKSTIGDRFIYAQIFDQTKANNSLLLVSKNWQYAVDRDYQEWKREID
ncbi:MAG: DUF4340 domain-containing protein [Cyanobacteria bacterium P01_F01_bin.143]